VRLDECGAVLLAVFHNAGGDWELELYGCVIGCEEGGVAHSPGVTCPLGLRTGATGLALGLLAGCGSG